MNQNERQQSSISIGGASGYNGPQNFVLPGYGYVSPEAPDRGSRLKQRSPNFRSPPPGMFFY